MIQVLFVALSVIDKINMNKQPLHKDQVLQQHFDIYLLKENIDNKIEIEESVEVEIGLKEEEMPEEVIELEEVINESELEEENVIEEQLEEEKVIEEESEYEEIKYEEYEEVKVDQQEKIVQTNVVIEKQVSLQKSQNQQVVEYKQDVDKNFTVTLRIKKLENVYVCITQLRVCLYQLGTDLQINVNRSMTLMVRKAGTTNPYQNVKPLKLQITEDVKYQADFDMKWQQVDVVEDTPSPVTPSISDGLPKTTLIIILAVCIPIILILLIVAICIAVCMSKKKKLLVIQNNKMKKLRNDLIEAQQQDGQFEMTQIVKQKPVQAKIKAFMMDDYIKQIRKTENAVKMQQTRTNVIDTQQKKKQQHDYNQAKGRKVYIKTVI